uniref:Uncharacterized protein n=1 Tax=Cacopsylla melanoneura TaxID=428564 RepID=A0A8D9AR86_9HEMI
MFVEEYFCIWKTTIDLLRAEGSSFLLLEVFVLLDPNIAHISGAQMDNHRTNTLTPVSIIHPVSNLDITILNVRDSNCFTYLLHHKFHVFVFRFRHIANF